MAQALYRKYRSKNFDEVVGQEHITTALKNALTNGKISHAYLFTGPRGTGKTSVARILAHAVNGLDYTDESAHLDIIEIDAASNRRIDEIRDLRDKVHVVPAIAKYKVYIIDEVHMLTREAFNALLKTLEEPPAHVIFIMATTEAHKLPETIISRAQRFTFKPIEPAKVAEHLKSIAKAEKIQVDEPALRLIAEHGGGSFRDSIGLLDQLGASGQAITADAVRELVGEAPVAMLSGLEQALSDQDSLSLVTILESLRAQGYESASLAKQLAFGLRQQLLDGQNSLPKLVLLKLLKDLIDVPTSLEPDIALELALLGSIKEPASPKPDTAPTAVKPADKPAAEISEPSETKTAAPQTGRLEETIEFDEELWSQVLAAVKAHHNTLYSVLRMAQPKLNGNELTLTFGFAFHKKRLDDTKNRAIIAQTISEITGQDINVTCQLDSSLAVAPEREDQAEPSPVVESISNIFGGAELLESEH